MTIDFGNPKLLRINLKINKVEAEIETAKAFLEDSKTMPSEYGRYVSRMLGFSVHNIYNGIEQIFEDVAKELDGGKPSGDATHADLLQQMAVRTSVRPPMITPDKLEGPGSFDDLRRFRHVIRHSYGMELREDEVREKFETVTAVIWPAVCDALEALRDHLDREVEYDPNADRDDETRFDI